MNHLKSQLIDFVDSYQTYFKKTFFVAITLTSICFVIAASLFRFSDFDNSVRTKQTSLLSYFFHRYSTNGTYSIIDLTKTVFIFFISLFSLCLLRVTNVDNARRELSFRQFFRSIRAKDVLLLTGILIISSVTDIILFRIDSYFTSRIKNLNAVIYIHDLSFHLRIYLPLIFFALGIRSLNNYNKTKLTLNRVLFLYLSLWLFNEFAFEVSAWVRSHVFGLLLIPVDNPETYYLIESIIGIPLLAYYFLGYFSAMTTSLKLTERPS